MGLKRFRDMPEVRSYAQADAYLKGRDSRKYAHATYILRINSVQIAVRYHNTCIVTFYADGATVVNSGGWFTMSTKSRFNDFLPTGVRIEQTLGKWYVHFFKVTRDTWHRTHIRVVDFADYLTIYSPTEVYLAEGHYGYAIAQDSDQIQDAKDYKRGKRFNGRRKVGGADSVWQRETGRPAGYYRSANAR